MKIGSGAPRRTMTNQGQKKQSLRQGLLVSKRRAEQRRALLRRGQPPRVMRSSRTNVHRDHVRGRSLFSSLRGLVR